MRKALVTGGFVLLVAIAGIATAAVITSPESATAQEETDEEEAEEEDAAHEELEEEDFEHSEESEESPRRHLADRAGDFINEALAGLVEEGVITREQLEAVRHALLARMQESGQRLRPGNQEKKEKRGEGRPSPGRPPLGSLEELLGIEPEELFEMLREGLTLPEALEELDVDTEDAIDRMVADAIESIDRAVENGHLDPERAEELKARITEAITSMLENGFDFRFRFGPREHDHPDADADADADV